MKIKRRGGFSLVEVSLALLVMAVGVLGAFSLFPHALKESQMASAETQASMFAESVFQTLRARAQNRWNDVTTTFSMFGPGALDTGTVWINPKPLIRAGGNVETFKCIADVAPGRPVVEAVLRYRLDIVPQGDNTKIVTLVIWPGEFGDAPKLSKYGIPTVSTYVYMTALYKENFAP